MYAHPFIYAQSASRYLSKKIKNVHSILILCAIYVLVWFLFGICLHNLFTPSS